MELALRDTLMCFTNEEKCLGDLESTWEARVLVVP